MKDLIEIHNQYMSGLITFVEFTMAFAKAIVHITPEDAKALLEANDIIKYKDMVEWERANGVMRP